MAVVKDKRIIQEGIKFRAEVEFEDGSLVDCGTFKKLSHAQLELEQYARDVALYKEVPRSVFIKHPI
jgi:hypothetical protein